jgi:hypothetical protein
VCRLSPRHSDLVLGGRHTSVHWSRSLSIHLVDRRLIFSDKRDL